MAHAPSNSPAARAASRARCPGASSSPAARAASRDLASSRLAGELAQAGGLVAGEWQICPSGGRRWHLCPPGETHRAVMAHAPSNSPAARAASRARCPGASNSPAARAASRDLASSRLAGELAQAGGLVAGEWQICPSGGRRWHLCPPGETHRAVMAHAPSNSPAARAASRARCPGASNSPGDPPHVVAGTAAAFSAGARRSVPRATAR